MSPRPAILPTRGSTPTDADLKLAADIRRIIAMPDAQMHALTLEEAAALVAAHRCRAEETVWSNVARALEAAA